jgi:hypothetical protein
MSVTLTPISQDAALYIENDKIGGQKWRLWIPEVFIAERDSDRFPDGHITVDWGKNGNEIFYVWANDGTGPVPLEYEVRVSAGDDIVDMKFTVKNTGRARWTKRFSAAVCLSNADAPSFIDLNGKTSMVYPCTGPQTFWDLVDYLKSMVTPKWHNVRFYVEKPEDPDLTRWREVEHGLVSRSSLDGRWNVAIGWDAVARVEIVMGTESMSCVHAHPQFEKLLPGETSTRIGRIWFSQEGPEEILQRYLAWVAQKPIVP